MRRILVLGCALALCFLGASALPAYAEETPPPVRSSPGDPFGGESIPPGPVFVITPGSPGSSLGPSADPEDVKAQIERDKQQQSTAGPSGTPTSPVSAGPTATVGEGHDGSLDPAAGESQEATEDDDSSAALWWSIGIGALAVAALLVVLLAARRRRDRGGSDSLNDHAP